MMNRFTLVVLACIFGIMGAAKAQTQVVAEELNSNEVQVTWGADWSLIEDFETGDFSKFKWNNEISDYPWEICTDNPYEGEYCMRAGNHNVLNSESAIQVTVDIPFDGYMTFYDRISADNGFDCGRFYIDDELLGLWTAVSEWIKREYAITQGRHTFKWAYTKEAEANWNEDCFWIDCINFCKDPDPIGSTWLSYATDAYFGNVGDESGETYWGYRWPERELGPYAGYSLTKVAIFSDLQNWTGGEYTVSIRRTASEYTPGEVITSKTVTVPSGLGEYVEYELDEPVYIEGSETLWMIWHHSGAGDMPAPACSEIDFNLDGEWFYNGGTEWVTLFYGAWMLEGYVLSPEGKEVKLGYGSRPQIRTDISYFKVYRREGVEEAVLLADQVTDTTFIDTEWATLEDGWYQWGVSAVYEAKGRRVETPIHWVGGEPRNLREAVRETEILWSNGIEKNTTGIVETSDFVSLYPNPTNGQIAIQGQGIRQVTILSMTGQMVFDAVTDTDNTVVDMSTLGVGVYMVRVATENGISTRRVTVVR